VSGEASEEIAEKLGCKLYMYEDMGHAVHEEAKDFNERVLEFLRED
jgi:pimeloyl-ACP methyl ester carboxylesterase